MITNAQFAYVQLQKLYCISECFKISKEKEILGCQKVIIELSQSNNLK